MVPNTLVDQIRSKQMRKILNLRTRSFANWNLPTATMCVQIPRMIVDWVLASLGSLRAVHGVIFLFCGPGWFVSIAYVDPGNYQADIQAGSSSQYTLLFALWWSCALSVYVQALCVRLAYKGQITLAEAQERNSTSRNILVGRSQSLVQW